MKALSTVLLLTCSLFPASEGSGSDPYVQITVYPYYHEPEPARRLTVFSDGSVLHEKSAVAVKVSKVTPKDRFEWIPVSSQTERGISSRKFDALILNLQALELAELEANYSAGHTYVDPSGETVVVDDSGQYRVYSAEATRVVTHGASYRIRASVGELVVDSSVYAPFSALEYKDPEHPDRDQILRIVCAWYHVLKAVGPVGDLKVKTFRQCVDEGNSSN